MGSTTAKAGEQPKKNPDKKKNILTGTAIGGGIFGAIYFFFLRGDSKPTKPQNEPK